MNTFDPLKFQLSINRRTFLTRSAYGLGGLALASLLNPRLLATESSAAGEGRWRGIVNPPHFPVRAKRIIHLCMAGGPSHLESFDYKPELKRIHGQPFPESFTKGQQLAQLQNTELKARDPFVDFKKYGQSGQEISGLFPHIGEIADDICIVRSMHTEQINHDPAHAFMNSGSIIKGRPSMGSWLLYGLGAETGSLPGLIELAFRMQSSVPDLTDFSKESKETLEMYGLKTPGDGSFASNCLLARRLAERGVRFIQLYHRAWDHHGNIEPDMPLAAKDVDQASAALVKDLKQRGMLDDTLIIWGGEFGRTPMGQGSGRDHHINAFSVWLAGGGIKGGLTWGRTDELGYRYVEDDQKMHVHDLHAT